MASNPRQSGRDRQKKPHNPNDAFKSRSKSQMKFEMSSAATSNDLLTEVTSEMNCPVCKEHLQQPIFMCETGHNICGSCKKNLLLPVCPLCKSTVTGLRNFALEAISSKISVPCVNTCYGCNFKCPQHAMPDHLDECKFKPIDCPFKTNMNNCNWSGNTKNLEHHFQNDHPQNMTLKPGQDVIFSDFSLEKPDRDLQLIKVDNNLFLYYVDINVEKKIAFWIIQMVGSTEEAQQWKYDFTMKNIEKFKFINFSEKCESMKIPSAMLFENGHCVGIPFLILKNFIGKNRNLTFNFSIRPANVVIRKHHPNKKQNDNFQGKLVSK